MKTLSNTTSTPIGLLFLIVALSAAVSFSYRGITQDEGLGGFYDGAMRIYQGMPLAAQERLTEECRYPARLTYMAFIALAFKLVGINVFALHLFPFIIQSLNPLLFFFVARRYFNNLWQSLAATALFLAHPFMFVFANQQDSMTFFVCVLLLLTLSFQAALTQPQYAIGMGILSSCLIITRLEDGIIFVTSFYCAYLCHFWARLAWKWLFASLGAFCVTHIMFAVAFRFPLTYPVYAIRRILHSQEGYAGNQSFVELTTRAVKIFMTWYFGGQFLSFAILAILLVGIIRQIKTRQWYPLWLFFPHILFLLFVYGGRWDVVLIAQPQTVIAFLLMLLSGIQTFSSFLIDRCRGQSSTIHPPITESAPRMQMLLSIGLIAMVSIGFAVKASQLGVVNEDVIPASTMWQIITANPPLPDHPMYQEPVVRLTPEKTLPIKLREEVYQKVLGKHRPESFEVIGKYAEEHQLFDTMKSRVDFAYTDAYDSPEQWQTDRKNMTGNSALWNSEYPGRLGAFPLKASGSFEYHFTFPKQIEYVIIQDIHNQWGPKDRMRLWTSSDGKNWTVRYSDSRARYKSDQYYQFFDSEFDGQTVLFIKYEFYAGDAERKGNDNRGASLDEFGLLVKYRQ